VGCAWRAPRCLRVCYKQLSLKRPPWHQVVQFGTTAVLVDTSTGITMDVLLQGLRQHVSRRQAADR